MEVSFVSRPHSPHCTRKLEQSPRTLAIEVPVLGQF